MSCLFLYLLVAKKALSAVLLTIGAACFVGLLFACYMLIRNDAVYKERARWLNEHPYPEPGDPDFWTKLRLASSGMELWGVVSYDEMYYKIWIPVHCWRGIAQERVEAKRAIDAEKARLAK